MKDRVADNWWIENLLRPVLIATMMTCLAAPVVQAIEWLIAGWDGTYFLVFAFFAGLEGILSERVLQKRRIGGYGYLASRGAEAVVLLLLLKLANYIPLGLDQLWADARIWPSNPDRFISSIDLYTGIVFMSLWAGALYVSRQVLELDAEVGKESPPPDKTSTEYYLWLTQPPLVREREQALNWLGEAFLWGGIMMLVASAAVFRFLPTAGVPVIPTLLYFALGIALLSQARFSVTHVGWQIQRIPIQPGIARRWLLWAVIFLVGVALVARILPTQYAMGPILALYSFVVILGQVFLLIITFVVYLFALLLSLFLPDMQVPERPSFALTPVPVQEPTPTTGSPPWFEVLLSALFWLLILVIVGYALIRFLQDRFGLWAKGEAAEGTRWGRFQAWLRDLWRRWRNWRQGVQVRLVGRRSGRKDQRPIGGRMFRFLSLRGLSPRELIRYFYLSAVRRATQAGQPRRPGQTPYEYRAALSERFSELEPDLTGLTEAFIQARYSYRPVQQGDAEAVKPLWQRIKAALRRRRIVP